MGQMGVWRIQESIQCRWKVWLQLGNNLHTSPTLKLSKQTAQSTRLHPLLSAAAASSYTKQGRFLRSPMLSPPNILFVLFVFCPCSVTSLLSPLKALPTMQTWIITKIAIPTNNMIKEITISITIILPGFHSLGTQPFCFPSNLEGSDSDKICFLPKDNKLKLGSNNHRLQQR